MTRLMVTEKECLCNSQHFVHGCYSYVFCWCFVSHVMCDSWNVRRHREPLHAYDNHLWLRVHHWKILPARQWKQQQSISTTNDPVGGKFEFICGNPFDKPYMIEKMGFLSHQAPSWCMWISQVLFSAVNAFLLSCLWMGIFPCTKLIRKNVKDITAHETMLHPNKLSQCACASQPCKNLKNNARVGHISAKKLNKIMENLIDGLHKYEDSSTENILMGKTQAIWHFFTLTVMGQTCRWTFCNCQCQNIVCVCFKNVWTLSHRTVNVFLRVKRLS